MSRRMPNILIPGRGSVGLAPVRVPAVPQRSPVEANPVEANPVEASPAADELPEILIPRPELPVPTGYHRCPTVAGNEQPLLRQTIPLDACDGRQHEGYHKCAQCVHRVQPQFAGNGLPPLVNSPYDIERAPIEV